MNLFHGYKLAILAVVFCISIMAIILISTINKRPEINDKSESDPPSNIDSIQIDGNSMEPTFYDRDIVNYSSEFSKDDLKEGRVVIFSNPKEDGHITIKRIVATKGKVYIKNNILYVNGKKQSYDYFDDNMDFYVNDSSWEVDEGFLFLVGDNYNNSIDSRNYGTIPMESVIGIVKE